MDIACNHDKPEVLWEITLPGIAKIKITNRDVEDLLVTSFEGGITYWCRSAEIVNALSDRPRNTPGSIWAAFALLNDGCVFIHEGKKLHMLTLSMIERGFRLFFELRASQHSLLQYLDSDRCKNPVWSVDMCQVDAGDADGIFQYALWGEWIYG